MLDSYTSRDQRIADLEIHGWVPVRRAWGPAIYNASARVGFGMQVRAWNADPLNQGEGTVRFVGTPPTPGDWAELTDAILDAIDARLKQI